MDQESGGKRMEVMTAYMEKRGSAAGWAVEALERMLGGQLLAFLHGSVLQLCGRHV